MDPKFVRVTQSVLIDARIAVDRARENVARANADLLAAAQAYDNARLMVSVVLGIDEMKHDPNHVQRGIPR